MPEHLHHIEQAGTVNPIQRIGKLALALYRRIRPSTHDTYATPSLTSTGTEAVPNTDLPTTVPVQEHRTRALEQSVCQIIQKVQARLDITPETSGGKCGPASELFAAVCEKKSLQALTYSVSQAESLRDDRAPEHYIAGHVFAVVENTFLVDMTLSQMRHQEIPGVFRNSGIAMDSPLAQELLTKCYIPLNDSNLTTYLNYMRYDGAERTTVTAGIAERLVQMPPREVYDPGHISYLAGKLAAEL